MLLPQSYVLEIVLTLETAVEHMKVEDEEGGGKEAEPAQQSLPLGVGGVVQQKQQQQQVVPSSSSQQVNPTQSLPAGLRKHSDLPPLPSESLFPFPPPPSRPLPLSAPPF